MPLGTSTASIAHSGASRASVRRTASTFAGFVEPTAAVRNARGTLAILRGEPGRPPRASRARKWPFSRRFQAGTIPSEVLGNPTTPTAFHVSTRGEYGMRLMVDLARHWGQGSISLHAVAQREDLPEAYLEQLVASLRKAGLVSGKRGAGGGYTLARDPAQITAGDVVRALEGPIEPQICTAEGDPVVNCIREQNCGTRAVWVKLQSTIAAALDGMTMAELAKSTSRERAHV
ncbi:MAG: Rrf2 family transcriptional regulator [Chloroflexi bacterium]|nr:MAG: Rrf2 family transcriptional regulator [Chloroflexota bacterium]TMG69055.1 MAG: Rrf2 family transcriptional regulator [Chloroflexota bacterium]